MASSLYYFSIPTNDFDILKNYQFQESTKEIEDDSDIERRFNRKNNSTLLAVDCKKNELCELSAADVTALNLFLRLFNTGKLKDKKVKLKDICEHLSKYDWEEVKKDKAGEYKVFANVSELAYKNYFYRGDKTLLAKIAHEAQFPESYYRHFENEHITARYYRQMWMENTLKLKGSSYRVAKFVLLKTKDGQKSLLKSNERIHEIRKDGYKIAYEGKFWIPLQY